MPARHFPVRPNLDFLRNEAKDLLKSIRSNDSSALTELQTLHPKPPTPELAKLSDAQLVLARSYGIPSWNRLVLSCRLVDAIWRNDISAVSQMLIDRPKLIHENARATEKCNWGPPMSYAANLGRDGIISILHEMQATDLQHAFDRACLQGRLDTARLLHSMGARPEPGCVMGPCETLNSAGLSFLLELGAELKDQHGDPLAPVGLLLQTYSRNPKGKHRCLDIVVENGIVLPDTPAMAVHRGRIDLLEKLLLHDPEILKRTYRFNEMYPVEVGCGEDASMALTGTPIVGGTLLHLAVEYDDIEVARWLISKGMDVNEKAAVDAQRFGGHTALYGCVVSQVYAANCRRDDLFARLLLENGADTQVRASLRKQLRDSIDNTMHEYRNVTPFEWGANFHVQDFVNPAVMKLISG